MFNLDDYELINGRYVKKATAKKKSKPKPRPKKRATPKAEIGKRPPVYVNKKTLLDTDEVYATFEIPGRFPTLNEILSAKNNPHVYNKMKKDVEELAKTYIQLQKPTDVLLPLRRKVRFQFVWYVNARNKDADNVDAARKFFIDAMSTKPKKGAIDDRIILSDNLTVYTEHEALFLIDKQNPRVIINLIKPRYNFI